MITLKDFIIGQIKRYNLEKINSVDYHHDSMVFFGDKVVASNHQSPKTIECHWDGNDLRIGYAMWPGSTLGNKEGDSFCVETNNGSELSTRYHTRIFLNC